MGGAVWQSVRGRVQSPESIPMWMHWGAAGFVAFTVAVAMVAGGSSLPLAAQLAFVLALVAPWIPGLRRNWMSWDFVLLSMVPVLALTWTGGSPVFFAVLALSSARVAVSKSLAPSLAYGAGAMAIVFGREFVAHHDLDWMLWKNYVELGVALGWATRNRDLLVARTREANDEHVKLAALDERRRIARDVHDVLAHTLTILMVQLNSARLSVRDDPEGTAELLDEVAQYGRDCLVEIRRTVGLLSETARTPGATGPIEAAKAIEDLVASYRKAGVDVDLRLDVGMVHMGRLAQAPTEVWSAGYRIVQEALANAAKHAPGSHVEVWIGVDDTGLRMECSNALEPGVVVLELPSGGHGVRGMRERVEGVAGTFSAGPEDEAWVVRADLPLSNGAVSTHQAATLGRAS